VAILGVAAAKRPTGRRLHLGLLDSFELTAGGKPVRLPLSAQRLLAFVALHQHPLQRQFVACSLWLDYPEERAHANLRTALWRIHHSNLPLVRVDRARLALDDSVIVDLREAEALARRIIDPSSELDELEPWPLDRELLPDWYDDWLVFERERHRQLRLHALEALCERLTAAGRIDEAVQAGLAAVASEPLRESAHRVVIRAHLAEGNACEALRQFELCRQLLHEHLGIGPSQLLAELVGRSKTPVTMR
jgi:DNA-binding SARP family transcriptional activator